MFFCEGVTVKKALKNLEDLIYDKENNMKWKELKIGNLPSDILTGNYEWESFDDDEWITPIFRGCRAIGLILDNATSLGYKYRYRKVQPKAPTHSEIMTKWWKSYIADLECVTWEKFDLYAPSKGYFKEWRDGEAMWVDKNWFMGRESSTMPPEA